MTFVVVARRVGVKKRILNELHERKEGLTLGNLEKITGMSGYYLRGALNELEVEGKIQKIPQSQGRKGRRATLIKILGGEEHGW